MALEKPFGAGVLNVCFDFEFIFRAKKHSCPQIRSYPKYRIA